MREQYRAGDRFGQYQLERLIGSGGFGTVWYALDTAGNRAVALKLLAGTYSGPDAARVRAEVELLAASASSASPHVVRVLDGGSEPVPHVVMEYVEGEDLAAVLRREGALPPARVIEVAQSIADALRALGEAGIIHRDLKPANVMIDASGTVKLADFGIAKIVGFDTVTATGQVLLSTAYSAPEVWEGRPGARSDLYALGALLYECLAGRPPFVGSTAELYRKHSQDPPDTSALPAGTPRAPRDLIEACLQKDREARPPDAAACLALLEDARVAEEPARFGEWNAISRHPSRAFSFICRHASTDEVATVEVLFNDEVQFGESLRHAVAANPALAPLGAERLLGTNRLVLHPDESWEQEPPGRFAFWLARQEVVVRPPSASLSLEQLGRAVGRLVRLRDAVLEARLAFAPHAEDLVAGPDGAFHLRRPGVPSPPAGDADAVALAAIRQLPLSEEARAAVGAAGDLDALAAALGTVVPAADATVTRVAAAPEGPRTVVAPVPAAAPATLPEPLAALSARLGGVERLAAAAVGVVLLLGAGAFLLTRSGGGEEGAAPAAAVPTNVGSPAPAAVATQLATPAPMSAGATFRGGPARTGLQPGPAPASPQPLVDWFVRAGLAVTSSPAVAAGMVVVGDDDGVLHVLDAADGRELASFRSGGAIRSSPAVEGGVAYFGSDDGRVLAVDVRDGRELWAFDAGAAVSASPAIVSSTVYAASEGGRAFALDATRGELVWSVEMEGGLVASPAVANNVAYLAGTDGTLRAIDARTSAERWTLDAGASLQATPAVAQGVVYVGDQDGVLHAVEAETGVELWSFRTAGPISAAAAVVGGIVFVASADAQLYALNAADGAERWRYRSGGPIESSPAIVTGEEVRYIATLGAAETVPPKATDAVGSFTITLDPAARTAFYTLFVPEIEEATIAHVHLGPVGVAGPAVVTLLETDQPLSNLDISATFGEQALTGPLAGDFEGLVAALEAGELYLNVHTVRNPAEEIRGQLVPDATGVVYVGSGDGQLHAVDAGRGVKLWSFQTGGAVRSSAAVIGGVIYFGSGDGHVYALGTGR